MNAGQIVALIGGLTALVAAVGGLVAQRRHVTGPAHRPPGGRR